MHICLVSREYPPFYGGGIGTYTGQFSRALTAAGHRVVVVTVGADQPEEREQDGDVTVIRFPLVRGGDWSNPHPAIDTPERRAAFRTFSGVSVFAMQVAESLPRLHAEFAFDVVEAPDTGALAWFALGERRTAGVWAEGGPAIVSCIHSPTDWIAHFNRTPLRNSQDLELVGMEHDSLRWSDALVCPSFAVGRWSEQRCGLPEGSVEVIPYCLGDLEAVARARLAEQRMDSQRERTTEFRVLFASRLEPRKGVDTLLAALVRAVEKGADIHLDLVGEDMPHPSGRGLFGEASLASLVPVELRGRVTFHGKLPPERVAAMQAAAHAVAIPAPMDNFPFACMEAMAQGRVVIAARAGGMEQMIEGGRSGILFEPGSAQSCAEALHQAATMPPNDAWELGRGAAARILDLCGNETIVERRVEHYRRAIQSRFSAVAQRTGRMARQVVMVNAGAMPALARERLERAAAEGDCDFAHGWLRSRDGAVAASSSPVLEGPALTNAAGGYPGPVALTREAAGHTNIARMLRPGAEENQRESTDGPGLVKALLEAGYQGAVVPIVVSDLPVAGLGECDGVLPPAEPLFAVKAFRALLRSVRR
jgi:glycogen synthase